ncbi:hypothetical protein CMUS01_02575 [Colletotrichum musicola]|uniref:Uncharacterized protein n=1 Tax=Colletotrichum musicola TaxID=2175873 RepID=A0A8H6NUR9_9PEZI|nr:hypothetical protein CMUS01_02575 [Colletotrichum musicola]
MSTNNTFSSGVLDIVDVEEVMSREARRLAAEASGPVKIVWSMQVAPADDPEADAKASAMAEERLNELVKQYKHEAKQLDAEKNKK